MEKSIYKNIAMLFCFIWTLSLFAGSYDIYTVEDTNTVLTKMMENIAVHNNAFSGYYDKEAKAGAVRASDSFPDNPKGFNQNYLFHWMRDSAITMNNIVEIYKAKHSSKMSELLVNYADWVNLAQKAKAVNSIDVRGEPKFYLDCTVFDKSWGRPQNDGPALRAITLINLANECLNKPSGKLNKNFAMQLYGASTTDYLQMGQIKRDLEYLSHLYDNNSVDSNSFGVWEEVQGAHFFNEIVQYKAMIMGANLINTLIEKCNLSQNEKGAAAFYLKQAKKVNKVINEHWNGKYIPETFRSEKYKGSDLDSTVIIAALYGNLYGIDIPDGMEPMLPINDRFLSTVYYLRSAFVDGGVDAYQINSIDKENGKYGPLIGRYPGDTYSGTQKAQGNPWFLCTNAMAEFYYTVAFEFKQIGTIKINKVNINFFKQIGVKDLKTGTCKKGNKIFSEIINKLIDSGDSMLMASKYHAADDLSMSEQIDRITGNMASAENLTWSYGTILGAMRARNKLTQDDNL